MSRFIQLHNGGQLRYINASAIVAVLEASTGLSEISTTAGTSFYADESPAQVIALMEGTQSFPATSHQWVTPPQTYGTVTPGVSVPQTSDSSPAALELQISPDMPVPGVTPRSPEQYDICTGCQEQVVTDLQAAVVRSKNLESQLQGAESYIKELQAAIEHMHRVTATAFELSKRI